jgi:beta-glucosidase
MIEFPKDFLWGAATSAYQVEGNNYNSDWWPWEMKTGKQSSGTACGHYDLYEQDFNLVKGLGHNAHRLSIEWARIEPTEGHFSQEAVRHYVDVIRALHRRGIEPVVTLHHFTNPLWFSQSGGWERRDAVIRFLRYVERVVYALAPHVRYWITINEPTILISHGYLQGLWPPQARSIFRASAAHDYLAEAHIKAYRLIHEIYCSASLPAPSVGLAHHMPAIVPCSPTFRNRLAARLRDHWFNYEFLDRITRHRSLDFIGLNYYSRNLVDVSRWNWGSLMYEVCGQGHHPLKKNSLGWDIYPEGLYQILMRLKRYRLPIIITENGICTDDDALRWDFMASHLRCVHRALADGAPVTGYLYWALLDNFEWDKGFAPRFGLIHVDYATLHRTIRYSAHKFSQVCLSGILE